MYEQGANDAPRFRRRTRRYVDKKVEQQLTQVLIRFSREARAVRAPRVEAPVHSGTEPGYQSATQRTMTPRPPPDRLLLVLAYLGFVSLGLPDAVFGIVWPSPRNAYALPQGALGWPLAAATLGYFGSGLLAGRVLQQGGVGRVLAAGTALAALGVAAYAISPNLAVFVVAALVVGCGSVSKRRGSAPAHG